MQRLALATALLTLAGCQQTLRLYEATADAGGPSAKGGAGGTAVTGGSGGGGPGGSGFFGRDGGGPDGHCSGPPNFLTFVPDTPQIAVALDRSSSMSQTFPSSNETHLGQALGAVYSQVSTYATPKFGQQRTIHFSFVDFPNPGMSGCTTSGECCASSFTALTTSNWDAATTCEAPPSTCVASSNRPTYAALVKADQALTSSGYTGPRYVLLISDGDPQGCSSDDCAQAQHQGVMMLGNDHITLEVVAITGGGSTGCLQALAMTANGTTHAPSYAAADQNSLFSAIGTAVSSTLCSGTLMNPPDYGNSLDVVIGTNGTSYSYGSSDGWTYDPMSSRLRMHGAMCEAYNQSGGAIFVSAGCAQSPPGQGGPR